MCHLAVKIISMSHDCQNLLGIYTLVYERLCQGQTTPYVVVINLGTTKILNYIVAVYPFVELCELVGSSPKAKDVFST